MFLQLLHRLAWSNASYSVNFVWMIKESLESSLFLILPAKSIPSARHPFILLSHSFRRTVERRWILNIFLKPVYSIFFASERICPISCSADRFVVIIIHDPSSIPNVVFFELNILNSLSLAKVLVLNWVVGDESISIWEVKVFSVVEWL